MWQTLIKIEFSICYLISQFHQHRSYLQCTTTPMILSVVGSGINNSFQTKSFLFKGKTCWQVTNRFPSTQGMPPSFFYSLWCDSLLLRLHAYKICSNLTFLFYCYYIGFKLLLKLFDYIYFKYKLPRNVYCCLKSIVYI